ncbi:hypothetical protein ACWOFR_06690 [Carnobacterium gallinarum]|uniref:hypothetical protein n=1 Tax=Carnobacterium gallinarum TaxID=2749 RepID=UPI0005564554|nr:hypothetical protein [Carnobacterium gallinarum]
MKLYTQVKALGKRRPVLELQTTELTKIRTLEEILTELVTQNVTEFNQKPVDQLVFHYLIDNDLEEAAGNGKIGFGRKQSEKQQDVQLAIENALQSFKDGIYLVLINDQEITDLTTPLSLKEEDVFTFIKLTMLSGRMW